MSCQACDLLSIGHLTTKIPHNYSKHCIKSKSVMAYLHKEYWEHNGKTIKVSVSFNRQQISWATGERMQIGYMVVCTPVSITKLENGITIEESGAFTGFRDYLLPVERQSSKRLQEAIKVLNANKEKYLNYFN
jgi:hypothetical protein